LNACQATLATPGNANCGAVTLGGHGVLGGAGVVTQGPGSPGLFDCRATGNSQIGIEPPDANLWSQIGQCLQGLAGPGGTLYISSCGADARGAQCLANSLSLSVAVCTGSCSTNGGFWTYGTPYMSCTTPIEVYKPQPACPDGQFCGSFGGQSCFQGSGCGGDCWCQDNATLTY
jgi:hypothetical protein